MSSFPAAGLDFFRLFFLARVFLRAGDLPPFVCFDCLLAVLDEELFTLFGLFLEAGFVFSTDFSALG